jgi:hypothetical protein
MKDPKMFVKERAEVFTLAAKTDGTVIELLAKTFLSETTFRLARLVTFRTVTFAPVT